MRRGSANVRGEIDAGSNTVTIEQVECATDSVRVTYRAPASVALVLTADDVALPQIDGSFDAEAGRGVVVTYPAAKTQMRLAIEARGGDRPLEVDLP
jgi:hypothetical protein